MLLSCFVVTGFRLHFDTADHNILLHRCKHAIGVKEWHEFGLSHIYLKESIVFHGSLLHTLE